MPWKEQLPGYLEKLRNRHPELGPLIALLGPGGELTATFLSAYRESPVGRGRRCLVLRAATGDPFLVGEAPSPLDHDRVVAIGSYFQHHPLQPLLSWDNGFSKDDIPKHFSGMTGISRSTPQRFLAEFALHPTLASMRQHGAEHGEVWPPFLALFMLDANKAGSLVDGTASATHLYVYFDTGDAVLDLYNSFIYLAELLSRGRSGGRIQNKIPASITNRWGIPRLSLPQLLLVLDVLDLGQRGLLDPPEDDWMGLAGTLALLQARDVIPVQRAFDSIKRIGWPDRDQMLAVGMRDKERFDRGQYDTSLIFNVQRLLTQPKFSHFAPYYERIRTPRLWQALYAHWGAQDEDFIKHLARIILGNEPQFTGISARDIAHCLALLWFHANEFDDGVRYLPPVARFALGMREPVATGRGRRKGGGVSVEERERHISLPLLEQLLATATERRAVLIPIGYSAPVDPQTDHLLPRSLAQGIEGLPDWVRVVGPDRLPWGEDPYSEKWLPELASYRDVRRLTD